MNEQRVRRRLEQERERLLKVRRDLVGDTAAGNEDGAADELSSYDQHPGDLGSETFEQEKNLSLLEQVSSQLTDVGRAMERVAAGTYGICEACGKPIAAARLDALPATHLCVDDQARAERDAGLRL